ncbi:MAG TPA: hypothetical protein VGQ83_16805 [Polyangia bacterium]
MGRRLVRIAITVLVAFAGGGPAGAHPVTSRTENNRYVKLTVMGDRLRVAYSVLYGELPSFEERREMDRDGDGRVAPAEARARADEVAGICARGSVLEIDGRRHALTFPEREATLGEPRVAPAPFSIDLWELVPLGPGARHEITFETNHDLRRMGETEIRFEEAPGTRLTAYCVGRGPCRGAPSGEPRFVWTGPRRSSMESRGATATFAVLAAAGGRRWALWAGGAALLLVAAAVSGALVWRRRR